MFRIGGRQYIMWEVRACSENRVLLNIVKSRKYIRYVVHFSQRQKIDSINNLFYKQKQKTKKQENKNEIKSGLNGLNRPGFNRPVKTG